MGSLRPVSQMSTRWWCVVCVVLVGLSLHTKADHHSAEVGAGAPPRRAPPPPSRAPPPPPSTRAPAPAPTTRAPAPAPSMGPASSSAKSVPDVKKEETKAVESEMSPSLDMKDTDQKDGSKYYTENKYSMDTYKEEKKDDPYQAYKPEYNETYYYSTPPPWYKPDKYYKPTEPPNAEPAPMPDPLKPYEKKLYYKDYTSTTWKPEPYEEPKYEEEKKYEEPKYEQPKYEEEKKYE